MAKLSPTLDVIELQKVKPTEGERALLTFLLNNLDDSYEIFYQPFLNGDNPDFAIMRKGSGVLLIEVKDWALEHYYIDDKTKWRLRRQSLSLAFRGAFPKEHPQQEPLGYSKLRNLLS